MKLSTTTRYGLKALWALCVQPDSPVSANDIAQRQNIPVSYLEQLFAKMRRGGILKSVRGAQGGYMLTQPPSEISVARVIKALGESIVFGDCQTLKGCLRAPTCPTFKLWHDVKQSVDSILENTTLEDIFQEQEGEIDKTISVREQARSRALVNIHDN